jgi:hypothetical protein
MNDSNFKQPAPSLRANGSRERAPDDRLHEAIHRAAKEVWIASSLPLLAMTMHELQTRLRDLAARFARVFAICASGPQIQPSLRANGSRECAPDDRLREAIHAAAERWIASSRRSSQ